MATGYRQPMPYLYGNAGRKATVNSVGFRNGFAFFTGMAGDTGTTPPGGRIQSPVRMLGGRRRYAT